MAIVTLTSDMGHSDYAVAMVKGAILSQLPDVTIVDISHDVHPFDTNHAAMMVRNSFHEFPKGSVHVIGVNPDATAESPHVVVEYNGHFFIGADNGVFSLIFDKMPTAVYELTIPWDSDDITFPVRSVFVKAACHLLRGGTAGVIGKMREKVRGAERMRALVEANTIRGHAVHIDRYGNVHSNISKQLFKEVGKSRNFIIQFRKASFDIRKISKHYNEVIDGEMVAMFNHSGLLEIAINRGVEGNGGGASRLLGLKRNDIIRIEFNAGQDS